MSDITEITTRYSHRCVVSILIARKIVVSVVCLGRQYCVNYGFEAGPITSDRD